MDGLVNCDQLEPGYLPPELTYTPVPLVAFFGLDPTKDETHSLIWSGFTADRTSERVPVYFKLWDGEQVLTPPKPKVCKYISCSINFK